MRTKSHFLLLAALLLGTTAPLVAAGGGLRADLEGPEKDGSYLVHTYMCGKDLPFQVKGFAEGVVNGHRRTVQLQLRQLGSDAVFQFARAWPAEGRWVIRLAAANPRQLAAA